MASTSTSSDRSKQAFFLAIKHFPPVINGRINVIEFIEACIDLLAIGERLFVPTVFAPLKYDMQGNIDKVKTLFIYDKNSCLLELMLNETAPGKPGADSVLWLSRALLFDELIFTQILYHVQANDIKVNLKKIFTVAYEGSIKKYHNWVTQEIFSFIFKKSLNLSEAIKCFEMEGNIKEFETKLENLLGPLRVMRCTLDDFFKDNKLFDVPVDPIPDT